MTTRVYGRGAPIFETILDYMGIDEARFWEIVDAARSPHLWERSAGRWVLPHQVS